MDQLVIISGFFLIVMASRQMGQGLLRTGLPLISAFLFTGILAGPYVLGLITREAVGHLGFIDQISLGFIAFAAGGELYLKELKSRIKSIAWITIGLVIVTFTLTSATLFFLSGTIAFMADLPGKTRVAICILAGAILVARSPSSAIAIVNELRAKGPFTQTALGVTIIMDVVVIVLFAVNSSIADALLTGLRLNAGFIGLLLFEIAGSVCMGFLVARLLLGILLMPVPRGMKAVLILLSGYLVFLFSFFLRDLTHTRFAIEILLEPLLICMTAGFFMSNVSRFQTEFAKILEEIGPPVYICFFTLTGASLSLDVLWQAWPMALTLFFVRMAAIFIGSFTGSALAQNPLRMNAVSWMAYITQAGVGLGLAKEVVVEFPEFGNSFATVMIAVIILNQIVGPPLFKTAIKLMKEDHPRADRDLYEGAKRAVVFGTDGQATALTMSLISQGWEVKLAFPHAEQASDGAGHDESGEIRTCPLDGLTLSEFKRIGCAKAGALVTMLSDEENFKICEIAYENFGTRTLVARLNERIQIARFEALGVLIVDPSTAIVGLLDHFVRSPSAASLFMGMQKEKHIADLRLRNPGISGIALRDLRLPFNTIIMAVKRRGVLFVPHGFTRLEAGDLVTVIGSPESIKELALRFDVNPEAAMLHLVRKAAPKELRIPQVHTEVKSIISGMGETPKDRFDLLVAESIVLDLKHQMSRDQFFYKVAHTMADDLDMPASAIFQMLVKREEEVSTVLAPGLAVPHIIVEGEKKFSTLLVRSKKGIVFSPSQPLVYAAFVLIGTKDERRFHLSALSAIAQIVMDPRFENKWMRARTKGALRQIIMTANRKRSA